MLLFLYDWKVKNNISKQIYHQVTGYRAAWLMVYYDQLMPGNVP